MTKASSSVNSGEAIQHSNIAYSEIEPPIEFKNALDQYKAKAEGYLQKLEAAEVAKSKAARGEAAGMSLLSLSYLSSA